MKFPWKVTKQPKDQIQPSDVKLDEIVNILFPKLKLEQGVTKDGESIKYHIDYSADSNLEAALIDLREGFNDDIAHTTISEIIDRLARVRRMTNSLAEFDSEAKYVIVDNLTGKNEIIAPDNDF